MEEILKIKNKVNREYFEYYAKYSLILSLNKKYAHLKKGESPDWQSDKLNIGVEVTRAIDTDIYLAYNIIHEYFGNVFMSTYISEKIKEQQEKHIQLLDADGAQSTNHKDISNIDNLIKSYIHKTEKLNSNYVQYNKNQLYMFTFKTMDEKEVKKCFDIDLSKYEINFDVCFINCFDSLYVCDFVKQEILYSISVDSNILQSIKKKALRKSRLQ